MAAPINSSALLQIDNDGGGVTFNAGFTFTAGRDAVLTLGHFATGQSISGVTIGGTTATLISSANKVSGSENSARIYLAQNIAGGTADVVITYSGGTDHYISGSVEEWAAGVLESSAVDTGTANSAAGTSTTPSVSTAATTSQANTIVYAVLVTNSTSTNNNITGPTGYTVTWTEQDSTNHEGGRGAWKEETTTGTKTATFGMINDGWGVAIVALKLASTAPVITAQPTDQTVNNGATATFSVTATGATSYQWQDNSSGSFADISGATSSSYVTSAATYSMQGRLYRCVVTNAGGSTNSNSAQLRVAFNLTGTGPRAYPTPGGLIGAGTVDAWLRGTDAGGGPTIESRTLTSAGVGAASFQSALTNAQSLTSAGVGAFTPAAAAINLRTVTSAGVGAANFSSALVSAQPMTSAGVATPSFTAASVVAASLSSAGVGAANFTAQAINAQTFTAAGVGSFSPVSVAINAVTLSSAGVGAASFVGVDASGGATIEPRTLSSSGVGAATFQAVTIEARTASAAGVGSFNAQAAATAAVQLSSAGVGAFNPQSAQIEARTLSSAGVAAASFVGVDGNTPTIEARTLSAAGAGAAQFVGENIGLTDVSGQAGASPYKKWRYYTEEEPQEQPEQPKQAPQPVVPPVVIQRAKPVGPALPKSSGELLQVVQAMAQQRKALAKQLEAQEATARQSVRAASFARSAAEQAVADAVMSAQAQAFEQEIEDDDQEAIALAVSLLDL